MKRAAKILSVALVAAMALTFSACSSSNSPSPTAAPTPTPAPTQAAAAATPTPVAAAATPTPAAALATSASTGAAPLQTGGDTTSPYTVTIYDDGPDQPSGVQEVNDAMTAYIGSQYGLTNTSVSMQFIVWNTYETVLNPMLAAGQQFDVAYTSGGWGFNYQPNMAAGGYLDWQPYLSYVPAYDQMIQPYVQKLIGYCNSWAPKDSNGNLIQGLYMLPTFKEWAGANCVIVNTTSAEQYGIDYSNIAQASDLTPLMAQYHAANPSGIAALVGGGGAFMISPAMTTEQPNYTNIWPYFSQAQNKYIAQWDNPDWQNALAIEQSWYQAGYVPDSQATDSTAGSDGNFLFYFNATAPVAIANPQDAMQNAQRGYAQERIMITQPVLGVANMYGNAFCLSKTSGNPDRAAMVYELICTDATLTNYWCFGVEGSDYTLDSNGQVVPDPSNRYNVCSQDYNEGNEFLRLSTQGEPASIGPILQAFNASAFEPLNDGFAWLMNTADINNCQANYGFDYNALQTLITNINTADQESFNMGSITTDQVNQIETQLNNAGYNSFIQMMNDWYGQWQADPVKYLADHS